MKKIAVVTATRAEYGLLSPVVRELRKYENESIRIDLIVTGTHLCNEYGTTVKEIEEDGVRIDYRLEIPVKSESEIDISHNQATVLEKFAKLFAEQDYNAIILLGDRYETLAVAIAAGDTHTPIFHLCGGDTTEGAIDEWIRHSITKISYLHFVTNEDSRKRVIQLGEDPLRVFNFGSTSYDNILSLANMDKKEVLESIGLTDCRYALCTYHPVTMETNEVDTQIHDFLEAIKVFSELVFIITKSNADQGGARINEMLEEAETKIENIHVYTSLGAQRYLSLMKYSEFVLGNSSSGIIETPAFQIPTVNIGDRQKGRLKPGNIIDCGTDKDSIVNAIMTSLSSDFKELCKRVVSPYGDGHAAERIAKKVIDVVLNDEVDLKKRFYNVEFSVEVK